MARSATSDDSDSNSQHQRNTITLISQRIDSSYAFPYYALVVWLYTQFIKDFLLTKKEAFFCDLRLFLYICASSLLLCHLIRHIIFLSAYMTDEHLNKRGDTT